MTTFPVRSGHFRRHLHHPPGGPSASESGTVSGPLAFCKWGACGPLDTAPGRPETGTDTTLCQVGGMWALAKCTVAHMRPTYGTPCRYVARPASGAHAPHFHVQVGHMCPTFGCKWGHMWPSFTVRHVAGADPVVIAQVATCRNASGHSRGPPEWATYGGTFGVTREALRRHSRCSMGWGGRILE